MGDGDERELRQFQLMEDRLNAFARGDLGIEPTIADLKGLLAALEQTPEESKGQFTEEWGELEIAYAVALEGGLPIPDAKDPALKEAVDRMIDLVHERVRTL